MKTLAPSSYSRTFVFCYAAVFIGLHLVASALLGLLLAYVFVRFGVIGLPGAHLVVLIAVALFTAYLFVRREKRLLEPYELWVLLAVCGAYIVLLDLVLARVYVAGVGVSLNGVVLGSFFGALDVLWLYLAFRIVGRWLMLRHLTHDPGR